MRARSALTMSRRWTAGLGLALMWAALSWAALAWAAVKSVEGIALNISDMDRSVAFYEAGLGFKKVAERLIADRGYDSLTGVSGTRLRSVTLKLGDEAIELNQFLSPRGKPIPLDSRSNDRWFQHFAIVVSDMDKAYAQLKRVPFQAISAEPQTIPASNSAAAGIKAFKFKDPDGHPLELLYFPPDKGRPKWHKATGRVFLGIDHSAITVGSTEKSLAFYRDILGLAVAGGSLNSGSTQERLDNAPGAVVRVTGLRPESSVDGPGIEFLEYVAPPGGRAFPASARPNDLVHVHLVLEVEDLQALAKVLAQRNIGFISPEIVSLSGMPFSKGLMVKDPDGHAVLLVQR